jgi:hypothetical protein
MEVEHLLPYPQKHVSGPTINQRYQAISPQKFPEFTNDILLPPQSAHFKQAQPILYFDKKKFRLCFDNIVLFNKSL